MMFWRIIPAIIAVQASAAVFVPSIPTNFFNFETAPVHPIALGPDGRTLAVCNLPDYRLELFDVSTGVPAPVGSVPVGMDPVTVRFASSNELWVVNHISSTISIIDLAAQNVVATLATPAGPSDLVFAGNPRRAWISCSRTNAVFVIDVATRAALGTIPIDAERPRSMATSPDGSKVYVAIFESGNGTTILGRRLTFKNIPPQPGPVEAAPGPYGGANPPPNSGMNFFPAINTNVMLAPPSISHIIRKNEAGRWMDDNHGDWTEWVSGTNAAASGRIPGWDLPDRDVAIINTATLQVSYAHRLMNICMAVAVNPVSGEVSVVGTDATNEKRFEPVLNGVFLRVNLALVDPMTRTNRLRDLNPHLDYITRTLPHSERTLSLGDPRGIEWNSEGTRAYITGMGSRNLIVVDANGVRVNQQPIELGEGPTGMALDESRQRLYAWNHFSSTISVVDTSAGSVTTTVAVYSSTPDVVRRGRRHFYDTRKTSGLGITSCAACHPDVRTDRLAWDLGNPAGELLRNGNFRFHAMKGPMVTQTLQDTIVPPDPFVPRGQHALHWRGDRPTLEDFNVTFVDLQANDVQLTTNEMTEFKTMLGSVFFPPNYLRTFSNTLPTAVSLPGHFGRTPPGGGGRLPLPPGNAQLGLNRFNTFTCVFCHRLNSGIGGITNTARAGSEGLFKGAQLRSLLDKVGMDGQSTNSRAGFGFMHDGRVDTLTRFLVDGFSVTNDQEIANFVAFLLCFSGSDLAAPPGVVSQDVPAATGKQVTLNSATPPILLNNMINLALRPNSRLELVVRGRKDGQMRSWLFRRTSQDFQADRHGETAAAISEVIGAAAPGNEFTATLVPERSGAWVALDRDGDGYFNTSEVETGFDPADTASHPGRIMSISKQGDTVTLVWESAPGAKYAVQWSTNLATEVWTTIQPLASATALTSSYEDSAAVDHQRFYRIRLEQ